EQQLQLTAHPRLPDELRERARTQRALERQLGLGGEPRGGEVDFEVVVLDATAAHRALPVWWAGPSLESVRRRTAGTDAASTSDALAILSSPASRAPRPHP